MQKKASKLGKALALTRLSVEAQKPVPRQAARAAELLAVVVRRMRRIEEDFFDIGVALKELKDKKLFVALGHRTFDEMISKVVPIGRSQAYKLIAIVERVTRDEAIELGEEKSYAIARLVAVTPESDTVASVLKKGVHIGKKQHAAGSMSRREIDALKRLITSRSKKPDAAERNAKREARAAQARLRRRGIGASIEVAKQKGRWWAVIRVPMDEFASLVGER